MDWLFPFTHWHWWTIALLLMGGEIVVPGVFLFWEGLAAAITGLALFLIPDLGWKAQLVTFTLSSAILVIGQIIFFRKHPPETDDASLNERGARYVGRTAEISEAIQNGIGAIHLDDTRWRVKGPDLPEGSKVKIVGYEGSTLLVEPVELRNH